MAGVRALHPLFEVRTERERFAIHKDDAEIGEIALDDTVIARAGGEPQAGVRRVEVEALTPAVEPLEGLVQALRTECTLELATDSKYRVGLEAAGLAPPVRADTEAPALDATMRIDAVAYGELRRRLAQWHAHEPGARLGEHPDELHQLRVAGRRIDATLRLFQGHIPRALSRTRSGLKKLLRVLGTCRDFDVQLAELERLAQSFPESERRALEPVRTWLGTERERARKQMLKALDAPATQRLFETLATGVLGPPAESQRTRPLAIHTAPELIRRRYRKFRKLGDRLNDDSSMEEYHRARTQVKKLRYAVEAFASLYGKGAGDYLDVVTRLQGRLGEQQDSHVAATRLTALAQLRTGRLPHSTAFLMGRMAERHDATALKARKRFAKAYRPVRGRRWKQMRRAMKQQAQAHAGGS
jgi:triphosphatase